MIRRAVLAVLVALALGAAPVQGQAPTDRTGCEQCHGELEFLRQYVESLSEARSLVVPQDLFHRTGHVDMPCSECHTGYDEFPHEATAVTESCESCHEEVEAEWLTGLHAEPEEGEPVTCQECHGVHDVAPRDTVGEGETIAGMSATCVSCHEEQALPADARHQDAAGCYACHAPHGVKAPDDPESWLAPLAQPEVCGACHDSVSTVYMDGVHAAVLRGEVEPTDPDQEPPTCTSCHGAHPVAGKGDRGFSEAAVENCITCHEDAGRTFFGTYHGKAHAVGSEISATCADCHGAHGILPADDSASMVHQANLVETCGDCHPAARPAFTLYDSHPDPMNRERNPYLFFSFWFMNSLLIGTLGVFGFHTLMWWVRAIIDKRRGVSWHGHGSHAGGHTAGERGTGGGSE